MPAVLSNAELLDGAVRAAHAAGEHALRNRHRRRETLKVDTHDVKLRLDIECQQVATRVIGESFPGHRILGEEDPEQVGETVGGLYEWIVDPIDGTVNFYHGLRRWCCSIAVRRGETIVAGAVYGPEFEELYTATVDGASYLNNTPINVSATAVLRESIVMTGADKGVEPGVPPLAIFTRIADAVRRPRIMGCAALDMCQVACGHADGYCEGGIYIWDVAAAGLIVQQAGGRSEILHHHPERHCLQFLSTNGHIHEELKAATKLSGI
jgi:myo-inositol-1(or 4)-monophosphatase